MATTPATFLMGRLPLAAAALLAADKFIATPALATGLATNFLLPLVLLASGEWGAWLHGMARGRVCRLPLAPRYTVLSCAASAAYFVWAASATPAELMTLMATPLAGLYLEARQATRAPHFMRIVAT